MLVAPLGDDQASAAVRSLLEPWLTVSPCRCAGRCRRRRGSGRRADPAAGGLARGVGRTRPALKPPMPSPRRAGCCVSDYGRGVTADPRLRRLLADRAREAPLVWDPHPRGKEPVPGTRVVTPNYREAATAAGSARLPRTPVISSATVAGRGCSPGGRRTRWP